MKNQFKSINIGITVKVLIFVAFLIGIQAVVLFYYATDVSQSLLRSSLEEKGITIAKSISNSSQLQILVGDYQSLQKLIEAFKKEHSIRYIHIYDPDGNLLTTTEALDTVEFHDSAVKRFTEVNLQYQTIDNNHHVMNIYYPIMIEELGGQEAEFGGDPLGDDSLDFGLTAPDEGTPDEAAVKTPPKPRVRIVGITKLQLSLLPLEAKIKQIRDLFLHRNILLVLIAFVIVLYGVNRIIKPFNEIIELLHHISNKNDLTKRARIPLQKEMSILAQSFNMLIEALAFQILHTKEAALKIARAIESIVTTSNVQEEASRDQVSAVTQTISSMAELSQSSRLIDQNSHRVSTFADATLKNAQEGVEAVNRVVASISEIDTSTRTVNNAINDLVNNVEQILEKLHVIDEFTEQTKLIAFNAALEASSVKTEDRRFGVVAMEVRKLAGDIEKSSRDINHVIKQIQETSQSTLQASNLGLTEVQKGVSIGAEAKEAITKIFQSVAETTKISRQISNYTSQQIAANDEVVRAVKEILLLAERSMDNAKETKLVGENLRSLSGDLTEKVEKFKI